jgi:uncharacterized protein (UPF0332 family)
MVRSRAETEIPEVVAPAAYYAMYHAAVAALVHVGIAKPSSDRGSVKQFARRFGAATPDAAEHSGRLRRGLERRLIADHDVTNTLTVEDARVARDDAVAFVSFCERLIEPA